MNFVDWVEKHRRSVLFVAFALTLAGVYAAIELPVALFPVVSFPRVRIEVDSGSMPANQMLRDVTEPLEEVARAVPGAVDVESTTTRGSAEIFVDFPWNFDMRGALLSVSSAFAQKLPDLPTGTGYDILQMSPTAIMPFVSYALISDKVSSSQLRQIASYQIAPLLTGIEGISRVGVLSGDDVASAITDTNSLDAVGKIEDNNLLYLTIANSSFTSVQSVADVALRTGQGR